ncbi:PXMP2/4 family protein 3-like isoform X2 [Juglans microcarpa x Juglans regia]|uniref:PXMP2/4 family protein 3-like isoform X2 n=1 Tax=Juglans microcarpa x Juglans regia TaxID=2249226 RepID=UPI001B7EBDD5|nr:PXMP2/4 family protein 3-like isoform X2 [Juglans microcarpa x Juglans regia]
MGSNFIRNVCRYETRLCVAYDQITAEAQSLTKHQHWRAYARFPSQFSKIKGPRTSSSHPWSFSSSTSSSSSSSSSSSPSYSKAGFVGWYLSKLESRPLITKSISSCLIYTAADLTSQMITLPPLGSFDTVRTLRMAAYGLLILGPSQHLWFNLLSKILPKTDLLTTLKKIIMGQTIYGPAITTIFFSYNAGLQGTELTSLSLSLHGFDKGPLMNSSCSYVWTIYLTYMASLKKVGTN